MSLFIAAAIVGYCVGTISFARLAARVALSGADITVTEFSVPGTDGKLKDGGSRVLVMDAVTSHRGWLATPEGEATQAILAEVWEFCRASQNEFDATEERIQYRDAAWLPSEMKEVVRVAFGCPE